jgi:uncharacterized hydantoinase/oxoprolinase family protein
LPATSTSGLLGRELRRALGHERVLLADEDAALLADVHDHLAPEAYSCPTADGRPTALPYAAERLARAVCADAARLGEAGVRVLAAAVSERQVAAIAEALLQVLSGRPSALAHPVVTAGVGAWLARRAAARLGLEARDLEALVGAEGSAVAPSVALAWLARRHWPQEA